MQRAPAPSPGAKETLPKLPKDTALPIRHVRQLQTEAATGAGRGPWIAAASGLVKVGGTLYVVADDEAHLGLFPSSGAAAGTIMTLVPGELPAEPKARKKRKPDFEALTLLPAPLAGSPGGALIAFGSGSTDQRKRAAVVPLGADGTPSGPARLVDLRPLYDQLAKTYKELNIEGAAASQGRFFLAQRGNGALGDDALIELDLSKVAAAARGAAELGADALVALRPLSLGRLGGVRLTITDLSPLPDGRLAFTAAAEDTANTYDDGEVKGSAVGILTPEGKVLAQRRLAGRHKIEGVHAEPAQNGGVDLLLVTDADDPAKPADLFVGRLPPPRAK